MARGNLSWDGLAGGVKFLGSAVGRKGFSDDIISGQSAYRIPLLNARMIERIR